MVVAERGGAISLFENGLHVATTGSAFTAEEMVHYAMLAHPSPQRVLFIGGLASGVLGEALRYSNLGIDIIERDAQTVNLFRLNFIVLAYGPLSMTKSI